MYLLIHTTVCNTSMKETSHRNMRSVRSYSNERSTTSQLRSRIKMSGCLKLGRGDGVFCLFVCLSLSHDENVLN